MEVPCNIGQETMVLMVLMAPMDVVAVVVAQEVDKYAYYARKEQEIVVVAVALVDVLVLLEKEVKQEEVLLESI